MSACRLRIQAILSIYFLYSLIWQLHNLLRILFFKYQRIFCFYILHYAWQCLCVKFVDAQLQYIITHVGVGITSGKENEWNTVFPAYLF